MRYHWGLGVGHIHAHQPTFSAGWSPDKSKDSQDDRSTDFEPDEPPGENAHAADTAHHGESDAPCESDNVELCLDEGGWDDVETDSADGSTDGSTDSVDGSADDSDGEHDLDRDSIEYFGWM